MGLLTPGTVNLMAKCHINVLVFAHKTKGILAVTMELSIIGMWCISSASINSCDVVEISSNTVSALHQLLWLVGTTWNQLDLV